MREAALSGSESLMDARSADSHSRLVQQRCIEFAAWPGAAMLNIAQPRDGSEGRAPFRAWAN
jgi:hypothetical protein